MSPAALMILSAVMMAVAAALLIASVMAERPLAELALETPRPAEPDAADSRRLEARLIRGGSQLWRRQTQRRRRIADLARLLRQAGYVGNRAQVSVLLSLGLVVLGVGSAGALHGLLDAGGLAGALGNGVAGLLVGAVLIWLWLRRQVAARREQLDEEAELLIQTTRMLWETGMTLEGVLRSLIHNLGEVLTASRLELQVALARIEAGQERGEVLEALADLQPSPASEAYFNLLAQVAVSGGGARSSLKALSELLNDRRRTTLQERVTKMSGKMSVVMMVFLFPVLLIIVAGPAVVNLGGLLQSLSGGTP
ncbi:type II secretion system F family protein [Halomonas mongoliensis]|uniref:type II secretion system F family protein n=1 Tax=Halomonas mongoliensis TaxID=321265 RepID=UPI00403AB801